MIILSSIEKADINEMPRVTFDGDIRIADTPQAVERAVAYLQQFPALGLDSETRPSFKKGEIHKVSLLQVSTDDVCYLFRLHLTGLTLPLVRLLENPNITKVGLSLKDDFLMLQRRAPFTPREYVELQEYVAPFGIEDKSLQKIYAILFNQKISKSQRLSNWEAVNLTHQQQEYAAIDAWACLKIYEKLENLKQTGDFIIKKIEKEDNKETLS